MPRGALAWRVRDELLTLTCRNATSTTWHQTLRRSLTSIADKLAHTLFGMPPGSIAARYGKLMLCFCISGALHRSADVMLGIPREESGALDYFAATALVIMFEDAVQHVFRAATGVRGGQRAWCRWFGYLWVCVVMYWMTPSWAYPAARVARPAKDVLVPVSVVRTAARILGRA